MKRIVFINRFFYPDHSATSQLLSDLAFALAQSGRRIHVITSRQLYDDPRARLSAEEKISGVFVHRVGSTQFGRAALLGRGLDYLSFYATVRHRVARLAHRGDIFVAMTDPPLVSIAAMGAVGRRGAHLVNWLQDLYPEVAIELGVPFLKGKVGRAVHRIRNASLAAAKLNVVVGQHMAERVISLGVSPDRVEVIHNWSNDEEVWPVSPSDNPLREEWGLSGKFVVGYSGNLGRAHEFETIVAASERLRAHPHVIFLLIGGGHRMGELADVVRRRGLEAQFQFRPYQDRTSIKHSLCVADVHWISLRPELEGLIVPSKFYGVAAAGRPIIAITAKDGEIARLVQQHGCGVVIEPGAAGLLADVLIRLSKDAQSVVLMGARARSALEASLTRDHALRSWGWTRRRRTAQATRSFGRPKDLGYSAATRNRRSM
jgi:colanic acid biosynthesis glycosyl transferase WcaI